MLKAYKYRLYPNKNQEEHLARHFGHVRHVYNWALAEKERYYKEHKKHLSRRELQDRLVASKKVEKPWLKEVNSQSLLAALFHLEDAFATFFRKQKEGEVTRTLAKLKAKGKKIKKLPFYPRFKSKKDHWYSFQCPQHVEVNFDEQWVKLPKIGCIKTKLHREFDGKIKTSTIKKNPSGEYYISILVDNGAELPKKVAITEVTTTGIDLGLHHFLIESNGRKHENPKHLHQSLSRLGVLQKIQSRKQKGSNNRERQRQLVSKQHQKITQKRTDFLQRKSFNLLSENQAETIAMEDLNVQGMMGNHKLARHIADVSWGTFGIFMEYKADWQGKNIIYCDRFAPSSKQCSCGHKNDSLTLADREWVCSVCGAKHDRDVLAAQNIKRFALEKVKSANLQGSGGCVKGSQWRVLGGTTKKPFERLSKDMLNGSQEADTRARSA